MAQIKTWLIRAMSVMLYRLGGLRLLGCVVDRVQRTAAGKLSSHSGFPWIQPRVTRPVQIYMYHGIGDEASPFLPPAPTRGFRNHMQYLAEHCHVLSLEEAVMRMNARDVPHRAAVVTIDDGYADSYANAFPILRQYGLPATIFLATGAMGDAKLLWHDRACWMIDQAKADSLPGFGSQGQYDLRTVTGRGAAKVGVLFYLRSLDNDERVQALLRMADLLEVTGQPPVQPRLMLTWEEVKDMHDAGIQFGAHTVDHPILSKVPLSTVVKEVCESKAAIEAHLPCPVTTFAYPSGRREDFTPEIKSVVEEAGFACAVSTMDGANYAGDDLYELKRIGVWDQDVERLGLRYEVSRFCA